MATNILITFSVRLVVSVPGASTNQPMFVVAAPSLAAAVRAFQAAGLRISAPHLRDYGHRTGNQIETAVATGSPGTVFVNLREWARSESDFVPYQR